MIYSWDDMIAEFRALGGTADNIVQAKGPLGRGIFPIDRRLNLTRSVAQCGAYMTRIYGESWLTSRVRTGWGSICMLRMRTLPTIST